MQLSTIKSNVASGLSEVKNRVQTNWTNLSTAKKVATVVTSVFLAVSAAAAAVFGHLGLAALAIGGTLSAAIIHGTTAGLGALGLTVPSLALLRSPKAKEQKVEAPKVAQTPVETAPEAVKQETAPVAEPVVVPAQVVAPSRLVRAKNASVAFVKAHPRKLIAAGAAIALVAGVRHAAFTSNDVKALGAHVVKGLTDLVKDMEALDPNNIPSLNF